MGRHLEGGATSKGDWLESTAMARANVCNKCSNWSSYNNEILRYWLSTSMMLMWQITPKIYILSFARLI
jgi:hypothetical protein